MEKCFQQLQHDSDCRAVLVSGKGKGFTSGIDLMEFSQMINTDSDDVGRKAFVIRKKITELQNTISSVEIVYSYLKFASSKINH